MPTTVFDQRLPGGQVCRIWLVRGLSTTSAVLVVGGSEYLATPVAQGCGAVHVREVAAAIVAAEDYLAEQRVRTEIDGDVRWERTRDAAGVE